MFATMRDIPYRILVMLVNIFFPPLAVMMLTGLGADTAVNCLLFLLAVIPSHIHGFYISWVYFWRRRKVCFELALSQICRWRISLQAIHKLTWPFCDL